MERILINEQWQFSEQGNNESLLVNLPHTIQEESLEVYDCKKGVFVYTKSLSLDTTKLDKNIIIYFEGVMTNCKVFLDDNLVVEHFGGYLPFIADITKFVEGNRNHILKIIVDNQDDKDTPPGKPTPDLGFIYFGGIYRNVYIEYRESVRIVDEMELKDIACGVHYNNFRISHDEYSVQAELTIHSDEMKNISFNYELMDGDECIHKYMSKVEKLIGNETFYTEYNLTGISEWTCENPKLYKLIVNVYDGQTLVDSRELSIGFRQVKVDKNGFYLNGKLVKLFGYNRHHQYPYLGIAVSNEAHIREARMIKMSGINCLRLAHYPQHPAFIDECDRLGIMLIDCVPGWQWYGGVIWKERLLQNVREMVRRDRNHASIVIYEVSPNETNCPTFSGDLFYNKLVRMAKKEKVNALVSGDTVGRYNVNKVGYDIPYNGTDALSWLRKPFRRNGKMQLIREYGDWGFGGLNSTSRATRASGELKMQVHAWNLQWSHNDNLQKNVIGDLIWDGIDHNEAYNSAIPRSKCGLFDIFRVPKFSYYFVASQGNPKDSGYVLMPIVWGYEKKKVIPIYSNCEEVSMYVDGKRFSTRVADSGVAIPMKQKNNIIDHYWATNNDQFSISSMPSLVAKHTYACMFDGGNCDKIKYPPFTFDMSGIDVKNNVKFVGKAGGDELTYIINKYGTAVKLSIKVRDYSLPLVRNTNDFIFVDVFAINNFGDIDYKYNEEMVLSTCGGECVVNNAMPAEAGIASFMIRSKAGENAIFINAVSGELTADELKY